MKSQVSNQLIRLERMAEEIRALHQTPLQAIAVELEQTLAPLLHPIDNVEISGPINRLADYLSELLAALPKTFGQRFGFDAALTAAVMDEWNPKLNLRRLAPAGVELSVTLLTRSEPRLFTAGGREADAGGSSVALGTV